jgi:hypothetical protein
MLLATVPAEAKCTKRDDFTFTITRQASPGTVELVGANSQGLGCWMLKNEKANKDTGDLCDGADGGAKKFGITVKNDCQKAITAVVRVLIPPSNTITFTGDKECLEALEDDGKSETLETGRSIKVSCKTKKYKKVAGSSLVYAAEYEINITHVGGQRTINGEFDPRIAVEQDGDVSTSFPLLVKVLVALALALAALLGGLFSLRWRRRDSA